MNSFRNPNGRYSEDVVRGVLAQIAADKQAEADRQMPPAEHVRRYLTELVGEPMLLPATPQPDWYPPGVALPDYVFKLTHSRYEGPRKWLRIYRDPTFKLAIAHSQYSDERIEGGVRLTLDIPKVGTTTVEILDVSDGHMSNW